MSSSKRKSISVGVQQTLSISPMPKTTLPLNDLPIPNESTYGDHRKDKPPKIISHFVLGEQIGKGAYGKVKEGLNCQTIARVAIKIINKRKLKNIKGAKEMLKNEIIVMKKLRNEKCPNILVLHEVIDTEHKEYIVLEYVGSGNLKEVMEQNAQHKLPLADAHDFFKQIILGLEVIHRNGIIHRDIKPDNLMITPDRKLKISDFGTAYQLDAFSNSENISKVIGTPMFQCPQIASGQKQYNGFKADIWAVGITLYNMVTGKFPFEAPSLPELNEKIQEAHLEIPDAVTDKDLKDLICGLLAKEEEKRFSIEDIKKHPWFVTEKYEKDKQRCVLADRWKSSNLMDYVERACTRQDSWNSSGNRSAPGSARGSGGSALSSVQNGLGAASTLTVPYLEGSHHQHVQHMSMDLTGFNSELNRRSSVDIAKRRRSSTNLNDPKYLGMDSKTYKRMSVSPNIHLDSLSKSLDSQPKDKKDKCIVM